MSSTYIFGPQSGHLAALGWNPFFESSFQTWLAEAEEKDRAQLKAARVIGEERGLFRIAFDAHTQHWAEPRGRLRFEATRREELPAVGDWIVCRWSPGQERAWVEAVLPRRSCLLRKSAGSTSEIQILASNVDIAFVVTSANEDFNLRRLDRYLAVAWDGGTKPVILVNKADLSGAAGELVNEILTRFAGVEAYAVSARNGDGMPDVQAMLSPGSTVVFLGSSGVGKSTLANRILGSEVLVTQEVREADDRGRHTTTGRHLFVAPGGSLIIDTPGMRELHLSSQKEGLERVYEDIELLAASCRFTDCGHKSEPGCAIQAALEEGSLSEDRYTSYCKLLREVEFQARKESSSEAANTKRKWKQIHRVAHAHMKRKRWEE